MSAHTLNATDARLFALAGKATITLTSKKTDKSYTYKITRAKKGTVAYFISLMTGPDNQDDFSYIGMHRPGAPEAFVTTRASRLPPNAAPCRAIGYFLAHVCAGPVAKIPAALEVRHQGKCGRCKRALTVPESIDRGIGPECAQHMGLA
jgi:hypothetical protein